MNEEARKSTFEVLSVETHAPARRAARFARALVMLVVLAAFVAAIAWHEYALRALRDDLALTRNELAASATRGPDPRLAEALRGMEQGEARMTGLDARIDALDEATATLARQFAEVRGANGRDWALAEAEYLERLAAQSLLMGREVRGALALLGAADATLRELDDPGLHGARAALATDIAALRAVADFDVEGVYLRLAALVGQVPALVLMERSTAPAFGGENAAPAAEQHWWSRVIELLGRFVVVRHRNESIKPLLPIAEEGYLRMNLRLGLEQAKLALLAAEPAVYRGALAQVRSFAVDYLGGSNPANRAFVAELDALAAIDIAPALPDISGSLRALRERTQAAPDAAAPVADAGER